MAEQQVLAAERHAALCEAFAQLPTCDQQLIALLIQTLPCRTPRSAPGSGIPVGSIRQTRSRCLDRLRHYPAIAALINAETESAGSERAGQAMMQSRRSVDGRSEMLSAPLGTPAG